jgi:hypothetical protein
MLVRLAVVAAVLVACAVPRAAAADRIRALHLEGWYGKLGLETGVVFARERGASPLFGATATFVRMNEHLEWYGLQGDLLVDGNGDRDAGFRWSLGPEFGVALYGIDISYFGERTSGETHHGFQVRAKLTVGLAALYVRGAFALSGVTGAPSSVTGVPAGDETSIEAGLQVKLPVFIARNRRSMRSLALAAR